MGNQQGYINFPSGGISVNSKLAEGGFGIVYIGVSSSWQKYAVKKVMVEPTDKVRMKACQTEANILRKLSPHPNIIGFRDSLCIDVGSKKIKHFYLLLELCKSTVWETYVENAAANEMSEATVLSIFHDVCLAVHHLHSYPIPIAHRDIKIENLLVGYDQVIKLCDFGSCSTEHRLPPESSIELAMMREEIESNTTLAVRAPEQIDLYLGRVVCEKVDVWALGVLLYTLTCGRTPFANPITGEVERLGILNRRFSFPTEWSYSPALKDLIELLLTEHPHERPSIYDVITHGISMKEFGTLTHWPRMPQSSCVWPAQGSD